MNYHERGLPDEQKESMEPRTPRVRITADLGSTPAEAKASANARRQQLEDYESAAISAEEAARMVGSSQTTPGSSIKITKEQIAQSAQRREYEVVRIPKSRIWRNRILRFLTGRPSS